MVTLLVCLVVVVGAVAMIVSMAMDDGTQPATRRLSTHRARLLQAGRERLATRGRADLRRLSGFMAPVPATTDAPAPIEPAGTDEDDLGTRASPVFAPRPEPDRTEPITRPVPAVAPPGPAGPVAVATRPPVPRASPLQRTARLVRGTVVLILLLAVLGAVLAAVLAGAAGLVALGVRAAIG